MNFWTRFEPLFLIAFYLLMITVSLSMSVGVFYGLYFLVMWIWGML